MLCGASAQDAEPAHWSRFRGPNGTGVAEVANLPAACADEDLVWHTELPGLGHSSPVLWGDRLFVTAEVEGALQTLCLAAASGEILWQRTAPRQQVTEVDPRNNAASPTPVVDAKRVVAFFPDFGLVAYDHRGEALWHHALGPFANEYGMGASPILAGDTVLLACDQNLDSFLLAVDAASGDPLWKADRPHAASGHCTPVLYPDAAQPTHVILPGSFSLDTYDLASGERTAWVEGLCFEMKSVPVLHDGIVYINGYGSPLNQPGSQIELPEFAEVLEERDADGSGTIDAEEMVEGRARMFFGFCDRHRDGALDGDDWTFLRACLKSQNGMLAIRAGGEGDVTESHTLWAYRRSVPQLPSPLLYQDILYMVQDQGGLITTLDPSDGSLRERGRLSHAVDSYYASPVAGDGKVYIASQNGHLTVLPAGPDPDLVEPLFTREFADEQIFATPALAPGRLFLRTSAGIYCFSGG